jgi:excisionase family DNA binding protein
LSATTLPAAAPHALLSKRRRRRAYVRPHDKTLHRIGLTFEQWERCQIENQLLAEQERLEAERQRADEAEKAPPTPASDPLAHRLTVRVATAASALNVSAAFVRTLIKQGKLKSVVIGAVVLITTESIRALLGEEGGS